VEGIPVPFSDQQEQLEALVGSSAAMQRRENFDLPQPGADQRGEDDPSGAAQFDRRADQGAGQTRAA
jgi:hypothetical protein